MKRYKFEKGLSDEQILENVHDYYGGRWSDYKQRVRKAVTQNRLKWIGGFVCALVAILLLIIIFNLIEYVVWANGFINANL